MGVSTCILMKARKSNICGIFIWGRALFCFPDAALCMSLAIFVGVLLVLLVGVACEKKKRKVKKEKIVPAPGNEKNIFL